MKLSIIKHFKQRWKHHELSILTKVMLLVQSGFNRHQVTMILADDTLNELLEKYQKRYQILFEKLTFSDFLSYIIDKHRFQKQLQQQLIKQLCYPAILLICAWLTMIFFKRVFIPSVATLAIESTVTLHGYVLFLNILISSGVVVVVITVLFILLLRQPIIRTYFYRLLFKHQYFQLIHEYVTLNFMMIFQKLLSFGLSTKDIIKIMISMKENHIVSHQAYQIQTLLTQGIDFNASFQQLQVTAEVKEMMLIAINSNQAVSILQSYVQVQKAALINRIMQISYIIKAISYLFIGVVMVLLYQIMMTPMQLVSQL